MEILFFLAGISAVLVSSLTPLSLALVGLYFNYSLRFIFYMALGIFWAYAHDTLVLSAGHTQLLGEVELTGIVASLPKKKDEQIQFEFLSTYPVSEKILLTCYKYCPTLSLGQAWRLTATVKQARQYRNPGSFDYVSYLRARHIQYTGSTKRDSFSPEKIDSPLNVRWLQWRYILADRLQKAKLDEDSRGVLEALTLGLGSHLSQEMWGLFRRTGTTHLMVISGAHIGLVAGLIYHLVHKLWRFCGRCCAWMPAMRIARYMGFFIGLLYALVAGFAVPAERAAVSFLVLSLRYCLPLHFTSGQAWKAALWFVLCLEPHAVLQPGLYLSFIAVAILIVSNQRFDCGRVRKMLIIQTACLVGLMPLTIYWFNYGSLSGFFANFLAIPWVSFILIPLGLLSLCAPFPLLLSIEHHAIHLLMGYLQWIDHFSWINITHVFASVFSPLIMMFTMVITVLIPLRVFAPILMLLFLSSWMPLRSWLSTAEAEAHILDVGQGLSVVVRTLNHTLVYDTGVKFYHGSDIGERVLIPFLKQLEINQLDKVVISHPDLDHRGGLHSLMKIFPVKNLILDDSKDNRDAQNCHTMKPWVWDGVIFEFLPIHLASKSKNNHSCVLKIIGKHQTLLLTGDIEVAAEEYLVKQYGQALRSDVLLVPHHGSKTSSSKSFLKYVSPDLALVSYGAENRYGFPHQEAMSNYTAQGIEVRSTMALGRLKILL